MKKRFLFGIAVAGGCLYFAFRGISFQQLGATLSQARPLWILLAISVYVVTYFLRAERWAILIKPIRLIAARHLFWPLVIGFFANNVLPLRMGELVRAHICGKKFKISRTASLGTILLERICDTLSFLATFVLASYFTPFPHYMEKGAILLCTACCTVIVLLILIQKNEKAFHKLLSRCPIPSSWQGRIEHVTIHFIHSTSGVTKPRYMAEAMAFSLVIWALEGTFLFLMVRAFLVPLLYPQAFFLLFAMGLSVTLPQAPGYVGTMELFGVTALSLLGIPKDQGLSLMLGIHGTQFLFFTVLGSFALWKEGLSFRSLASAAEEEATDTTLDAPTPSQIRTSSKKHT